MGRMNNLSVEFSNRKLLGQGLVIITISPYKRNESLWEDIHPIDQYLTLQEILNDLKNVGVRVAMAEIEKGNRLHTHILGYLARGSKSDVQAYIHKKYGKRYCHHEICCDIQLVQDLMSAYMYLIKEPYQPYTEYLLDV